MWFNQRPAVGDGKVGNGMRVHNAMHFAKVMPLGRKVSNMFNNMVGNDYVKTIIGKGERGIRDLPKIKTLPKLALIDHIHGGDLVCDGRMACEVVGDAT